MTGERRASEPAAGGLDRAEILARLGGDEQLLRGLAGMFLAECPGWLEAVRDAVIRRDAAERQRVAHTLRGAVGTFGAGAASEAALRLEALGHGSGLAGAAEVYRALKGDVLRLRTALAGLVSDGAR